MKIFTGTVPENPYPKTHRGRFPGDGLIDNPVYKAIERYRQSILSQMVEVDLDILVRKWMQSQAIIFDKWVDIEFSDYITKLSEKKEAQHDN